LPRYQPVTIRAAEKIILKEKRPPVFFFDRASPGAVFLAESYANAGSLIVFEPSGQAEPKLQEKALRIAHICKYSGDQFSGLYPGRAIRPLVEIQTMGGEGLRFRTSLAKYGGEWRSVAALPLDIVKDSAGAGDWLSAGLISLLGREGLAGLQAVSKEAFVRALSFGQSLAAWNCQFEGARGGMYSVSKNRFQEAIRSLMAGESVITQANPRLCSTRRRNFRCPRSTCRIELRA
jgi:fructokinase